MLSGAALKGAVQAKRSVFCYDAIGHDAPPSVQVRGGKWPDGVSAPSGCDDEAAN
jgi:hypothetical protein